MLLLLSLLLVSCGGEPTPPVEPDAPSSDPNEELGEAPSDKFNFYHDGELLSVIIIPEKPTAEEREIARRVLNAVFQRARKELEIISDSEFTEAPKGAIIIGSTTLAESVAAYSSLPERGAIVKVEDGKLVIAFDRIVSANLLTTELIAAMTGDYKSTLSIPLDLSLSVTTLPTIEDLPELQGSESYFCGEKSDMLYADATPESFDAYCDSMKDAGFDVTSERESEGNRFATFVGHDLYAYVYYTAYSGKIRVITGPIETLAEEDYSTDTQKTYTPYIASIPQPNNGLGLIMRLPDGRFIIHDGGYSGGDRVYKTLRQLKPEGEIVIAAWFVSHPHGDHYVGFTDFIKSHGKDSFVTIERVMLNFAEPKRYVVKTDDMDEDCSSNATYVYKTIKSYIPNVPVIEVHTGQVFDFGDATVEVLYTVEDIMPISLPNVNDSSLVIRFESADTSFMILADTCYKSGPILNDMWGDYLKSDIVQVAHHGQWPSVESIYHSIAAEVVLVPAVTSRYKSDISDSRWSKQTKAILGYAKDLYTTCDEIIRLDLPYVIKNNKDEMVEYIKSYVPKEGEPTS